MASLANNMNEIPTAKIAYDAVREVTFGPGSPVYAGPSLPWQLLKAGLPRQPTIFIVLPAGSAGDLGPSMRLLADLVDCLRGRYYLLRTRAENACWDTMKEAMQNLASRVTETKDAVEWLHQMRTTPPDAVITNQLLFRSRSGPLGDGRHWERFLHDELFQLPQTKQVPVILIEFIQGASNYSTCPDGWQDKVDSGEIAIEVYKAWQTNHSTNVGLIERSRSAYGRRQLPSLLMLECYPAELLTKQEMAQHIGIVCGHVEPAVEPQSTFKALDSFVSDSRTAGRKIVMLARGGGVANHTSVVESTCQLLSEDPSTAAELLSIVDYGLATRLTDHAAVIAQGAAGSQAKRVTKHIFSVPRMELDFSQVLPKVDLVIHHGGSGTTFASLKAGIPQIIIPGAGDAPDQIHHGGRIDTIGCGRFLRPRSRFGENVGADAVSEVVEVVEGMLQDNEPFKEACLHWQSKIKQCGSAEGVPIAVDTLRRIIAKILLGRPSVGDGPSTTAG